MIQAIAELKVISHHCIGKHEFQAVKTQKDGNSGNSRTFKYKNKMFSDINIDKTDKELQAVIMQTDRNSGNSRPLKYRNKMFTDINIGRHDNEFRQLKRRQIVIQAIIGL